MIKVQECMTLGCITVTPSTTIAEVSKIMRDEDIGFVPVVDDDRMIGMVTDRDIVIRCMAAGIDPNMCTAHEAMTARTFYCFVDQTVEDVAENMGDMQIRRLPVVNRDRKLVGVISLGDIAQAAATRKVGEAEQLITQRAA